MGSPLRFNEVFINMGTEVRDQLVVKRVGDAIHGPNATIAVHMSDSVGLMARVVLDKKLRIMQITE